MPLDSFFTSKVKAPPEKAPALWFTRMQRASKARKVPLTAHEKRSLLTVRKNEK